MVYDGDSYSLRSRFGYLLVPALWLASFWLTVYGQLYVAQRFALPAVYPAKLLILSPNAHLYIAMGCSLVMIVVGCLFRINRVTGFLALVFSVCLLGNRLYDMFILGSAADTVSYITLGLEAALAIIGAVVKVKGDS